MKKLLKFQHRVYEWTLKVFGDAVTYNVRERGFRFTEEALELAQAVGVTRDEAVTLVDYVFNRPVGEVGQEIGGVMVTLAALANVCGPGEDIVGPCVSIGFQAKKELKRIEQPEVMEKIRHKHATKPGADGPLPGSSEPKIADYAEPFYIDRQLKISLKSNPVVKPPRTYDMNDLYRLRETITSLLHIRDEKVPYNTPTPFDEVVKLPPYEDVLMREQQALRAFTEALDSVYRASIPPAKITPLAELNVPAAAELHDALHHFLNAAYRLEEMKQARKMPGYTDDIAEPGMLKARKNDATTAVYAAANKLFGRTV